MASISWTDGTGAATLTNGLPAPASRFRGWTPAPEVVGDLDEALGTGTLYAFTFRSDYQARFRLERIPNASQALLERLLRHLKGAGTVSVTTDDAASRTYATCQMVKDAPPELAFDARTRTWALTLTLRNVAGSPAPMLCIY